ncbi:PAS domain-containing sensor histidine kinase [Anoxynatronum sibiricum]|uniref:histidine kinase n=1 Tax=Anoxynatronum sibiricum TaxID=210623 RepID=A0ABU9VVD6_9CLOT
MKRFKDSREQTRKRRRRRYQALPAEKLMTAKENAFHDVMMKIPALAVQGYRMDGTTVYWNEASEKLYGYTQKEALGKSLLSLIIPPEMHKQVKEHIRVMSRTKIPVPAGELTLKHREGTPVEVFSSHSIITLKNGDTYLYCFDIDLSERNAIRETMRMSEERYRLINQVSGTGSWEYNAETRKDWYSPMYFNMLGYDETEFLSPEGSGFVNAWQILIHPDERVNAQEHLDRYLAGGSKGLYEATFRMKRKDGTWAWILSRGKTLQDENGHPTSLTVGTHVDITHSKQIQLELEIKNQELTEAKAAAEVADRVKSQFLANMSHELRTPLNGLMGMTQLMQLTELTEEQAEYLNYTIQSCKSLVTVVEEILNYTSMEIIMQKRREESFHLEDLLKEVAELHQPTAINKGLVLSTHRAQSLPNELVGDRFKLKQILGNLVGNAVKFTESGTVQLVASQEVGKADPGRIRITFRVKDTGIGIPKEKLDHIFQQFSQADESDTRKYGGLGLGLAVARKLAAIIGYSLTAESTPGKGSVFTLTGEMRWVSKAEMEALKSLKKHKKQ